MFSKPPRRQYVSSVPTVVKKKKKSLAENYQTFNQSEIFQNTEESKGNLLAVITSTAPELRVKVLSHATTHIKEEWPVTFRNRMENDKPTSATPSAFRPRLSTIKSDDEDDLREGDLIELDATMIDDYSNQLFPWKYNLIARSSPIQRILPMPECWATIISSRSKVSDTEDYSIGIAARGEARQITSLLDNVELMRSYLGYKQPIINGFILRGQPLKKSSAKQGVTCFRTAMDDQNEISDDQVIMNFLSSKADLVLEKISEENPWDIIPIYMVKPASIIKARVENLARRFPNLVTPDTNPYNSKFAHFNIALSFESNALQPRAKYFNISRSKPLVVGAGLPERATEKKLTVFKTQKEPELA